MTTIQQQIWLQIEPFQFDEPDTIATFSNRLAKEQGWTTDFTHKAIMEYKRFMLLAATCDFSVTPSKAIDEVWHTHLTYTRNYWEAFCPLLGKPIHHTPSSGGQIEEAKYRDYFHQTLEAYKIAFDVSPPLDIWLQEPNNTRTKEENKENYISTILGILFFSVLAGVITGSVGTIIFLMLVGSVAYSVAFPSEINPNSSEKNIFWGGGCSTNISSSESSSHCGSSGSHCGSGGHCGSSSCGSSCGSSCSG
ncbi:MAG: hypothetical protein RLZZ292_1523 [Bacteroidota bacterium]|jgi:hypothetical protein